MRKPERRLSWLVWLGLILLTSWPAGALAQSGLTWSPPKRIPDYNDPLRAPFLVADQDQTVHAFNYETSADQRGIIVYRRWSLARGWSSPVDVISLGTRTGPQEIRGVLLDGEGKFHLVYYSGTELAGAIYYTWAYASVAGRAGQWQAPIAVGPDAGPVVAGSLIEAGPKRLVMVYGGQGSGLGLYEVHSLDAGQTWSRPVLVSRVTTPDIWPAAVWMTNDELGQVHVVWHLTNTAGQGAAIQYARLQANLAQWGQPTTLAERDTDLENMGWASIIAATGKLIVAYQDGFPPTRWVRQSTDGGLSWTAPVRPFTHIGGYEYTALLKDSDGKIHMVLGNRIAQPEIHGMWYSRLVGELWTPLEPITSGPSTTSYDPCCPRAVISQGNVLLATWPHNVRQDFLTGAWFSYTLLEAPELPVAPLPTPAQATSQPEATGAPEVATNAPGQATPLPTLSEIDSESGGSSSPTSPIYFAVIPVALVLVGFIVIRLRRQNR